jgi:hypothetical protein
MKCSFLRCEDRKNKPTEEIKVTKSLRGLLNVLRQSINEAILQSNDVAAAIAALKSTGKCPLFSIEVGLEESVAELAAPPVALTPLIALTEELVLSDEDVAFLAALGITDPSWCCSTPQAGTA